MKDELDRRKLKELEPLFYPRSIAVAGVSTNELKMGSRWLKGLLSVNFKGKLYAVNPNGGQVFGLEIHPSLKSIPGPVDLVISCVPRTAVLDLLDDCAAKGIKAIQFFTAGFRETGDPQWIEVEEEMTRRARRGGFRIIGPNCIGVSCPEQGIPYGPSTILSKAGSIGYISQSGGHVGKMVEIGLTRGIRLSKAISMGNGCDLGSADFLEYLAVDPKTDIIGLYLEGPRDSRRLFEIIRAASRRKPVVAWKGGRTEAGARATASHTGALAASANVWSAALRQAGAIEVQGLEELADTLLLFQKLGQLKRSNVGIICGLTDGGGGEAVLAADACATLGVAVPPLTEKTHRGLLSLLGQVGSVLCNPVDISQGYGNIETLRKTMDLLAGDSQVDIIVLYENVDILSRFVGKQMTDELNGTIINFSHSQRIPLVAVLPPGSLETERLEAEGRFVEAGLPVYPSIDRAARAIANVSRFRLRTKP